MSQSENVGPLSLDITLEKATRISASSYTGYRYCPFSKPCHRLRGAEGIAMTSQTKGYKRSLLGPALFSWAKKDSSAMQRAKMLFKASILTLCASHLASIALGCELEDSSAASPIQVRAPARFKYPGVSLDIEQLNFIKSKVNSSGQPWSKAYKAMLSSNLGSTTRAASPRATIECGSFSMLDNGLYE